MTIVGLPGCGGGGSPNVNGDEAWQPSASFVGPDDEVVFYHEQPRTARSARRPQGGSVLQAKAQQDMLGTPAIQTDETGAVYNRQSSTPYGVRTGHEGSGTDEFKFTDKQPRRHAWGMSPQGGSRTRVRRTMRTRDDDLGLVYFGARYYDPELSTWISVDPLVLWGDDGLLNAFDQNPLAYVGGRVTLAVDAFGFNQYTFYIIRYAPFNTFGGAFSFESLRYHGDGASYDPSRPTQQTFRTQTRTIVDTATGMSESSSSSSPSTGPCVFACGFKFGRRTRTETPTEPHRVFRGAGQSLDAASGPGDTAMEYPTTEDTNGDS